jgi:serine/threonine-protein kinase
VAIIRQIASALDAAHESGVMHRDVKPENILITRDDFAYLVDFGIANAATDEKLTELGTAVGTYAYMAPERFTEGEVTYRADIYALACVLHECLTGGQPYPAESVSVVITAHLMQPIPQPSVVRPGIPTAFDEVISRGMAKDPNDRYATAGDLATAAHDALGTRDQDKADTILARSAEATIPGVLTAPPRPASYSTPAPSFSTPPPAAATPASFVTQPPSTTPPRVVASTQPPYQPPYQPPGPTGPGGWGPTGPTGPGGTPPWQPPPSGPFPSSGPPGGQPPKRNWVPIIIAAVVAFLLVLGGVVTAVLLMNKDNNGGDETTTSASATTSRSTTSSTKTRTPSPPTTPPTTGQSGASARLMSLLPDGYGAGVCKPIDPVTDALATVDCDKNSQTGGPEVARYSLFPDQATLDQHFDTAIKEDDELLQCPGSNVQSPTTWHYTSTPDKVEGRVACGTYKGGPDVLWTRNADLMLADGQGPDLTALHDWWLKYG